MSATTLTAPPELRPEVHAPTTGGARVLAAARVQILSWGGSLLWPWLILASAFAVNWAIFAVLRANDDGGDGTTGGLVSIYIVVFMVAVAVVFQFLPFSLGLGLTRRAVFLGALLVATAQAVTSAIVLTGLLGLERATDGWGIDLHFFGVGAIEADNPVSQVLVYAAPFLFLSAAGLLAGAVAQRWGTSGIYAASILGALVIGLVVMAVTLVHGWDEIGRFLGDSPLEVVLGLMPLAGATMLAAVGYGVVRGSTV